jgi:hypothetical protein
MEIEEMLKKIFGGNVTEDDRARLVVQHILEIIHPKFIKLDEGHGHVADEEGYIKDWKWNPKMLGEIANLLYGYGFGPDSCVKGVLELEVVALEAAEREGE